MDNLPQNLEILDCSFNPITQLDNLPASLIELWCWNNKLTHLDNLPPNIKQLWCDNNNITHLDNLPSNIEIFSCSYNNITHLDNLPVSDIGAYEEALLHDIRGPNNALLQTLAKELAISDEFEKTLTTYFKNFTEGFRN